MSVFMCFSLLDLDFYMCKRCLLSFPSHKPMRKYCFTKNFELPLPIFAFRNYPTKFRFDHSNIFETNFTLHHTSTKQTKHLV